MDHPCGLKAMCVYKPVSIYRKNKKSQGNIFTAPMASGGGLTDLILRCLVFWFGFYDRKIKTFQGKDFTVSSALVIKFKVVEDCLTVKN